VGLGEVPAAVLKYKPEQSSGGDPFLFHQAAYPAG
jgi:hypothetical protein